MTCIEQVQRAGEKSRRYASVMMGLNELLAGLWFLAAFPAADFLPRSASVVLILGVCILLTVVWKYVVRYYSGRTGYAEPREIPALEYGLMGAALVVLAASVTVVLLSPSLGFGALWWLPLFGQALAAVGLLARGIVTRARRHFYLGAYLGVTSLLLPFMPAFHTYPWTHLGVCWGAGFVCCGVVGYLQYLGMARSIPEKRS